MRFSTPLLALLLGTLTACGGARTDTSPTAIDAGSDNTRESAMALPSQDVTPPLPPVTSRVVGERTGGGWVTVAREWFEVPFTLSTAGWVRYGYADRWSLVWKPAGRYDCHNDYFRNPDSSEWKVCQFYEGDGSSTPPTSNPPVTPPSQNTPPALPPVTTRVVGEHTGGGWVTVAREWFARPFTLQKAAWVRYGYADRWTLVWKDAGNYDCHNDSFRNPDSNEWKICQVYEGSGTAAPPVTPPPVTPPPVTPPPVTGAKQVIYINDQPNDVYTDAYIFALASNREIDLRGVISAGVGCRCDAGDNYTITNTPQVRDRWLRDARAAGFRLDFPHVSGPDRDTASVGVPPDSAGAQLIISEARKASADRPLYLVVGGPITVVASALVQAPDIRDRVVVHWIAGDPGNDRVALGDWNEFSDPWATRQVLSSVRSYLYPVLRDPPLVVASEFRRQLPAGPFLDDFVVNAYYCKGNLGRDCDGDGSPAAAVAMGDRYAPASNYSRRTLSNDRLVDSASGNVWVMLHADGNAAAQDYYRALRQAYGVR